MIQMRKIRYFSFHNSNRSLSWCPRSHNYGNKKRREIWTFSTTPTQMKNLKKQLTILLLFGNKEKKLRSNEKTWSNGTNKRLIQISRTRPQNALSMRNIRDNAIMRNRYPIGNFKRYEIYRKSQRMSRTTPPKISKSWLIRLTPKVLEWKNWKCIGVRSLNRHQINKQILIIKQIIFY